MKRKTLVWILALMIIATVTATTFYNSKEEAITNMLSKKAIREDNLDTALKSIEYLSEKVCTVNYNERIKCEVEVNYTIDNTEKTVSIRLTPDTTEEVDDETVKIYIKEISEQHYPKETTSYIERDMTGRNIDLKKDIEK